MQRGAQACPAGSLPPLASFSSSPLQVVQLGPPGVTFLLFFLVQAFLLLSCVGSVITT